MSAVVPLDLARQNFKVEMANLLMGKPLGCTGEAQCSGQWHSRWEYPCMKHGETAGTGGNENMKGARIV